MVGLEADFCRTALPPKKIQLIHETGKHFTSSPGLPIAESD